MKNAKLVIEDYLSNHYVNDISTTFGSYVFDKVDKLLAEKQITKESQVYHRGGIDRRVYSNLKQTDENFRPQKATALAFCVALQLSVKEAEELLSLAEYHFETRDLTDQIVKCCLEKKIYELDEINIYIAEAAEKYGVSKPRFIGTSYRK